jgi:hypothetical protein
MLMMWAPVDGVPDRVGDVLVALVAVGHGANQDARARGDAVDADVVAALCGDDAGDTRAV